MSYHHIPVLLHEVIQGLRPQPNENFIDGTVGGGGHAAEILKATAPHGQLLVFDKDPQALIAAKRNLKKFGQRVHFVRDSYAEMVSYAKKQNWSKINGVLLDLGLSSDQLADINRGFSFKTTAPLDMRFNSGQGATAADILNQNSEYDLLYIFKNYGEEPKARALTRAVISARKIKPFVTTDDFLKIVLQVKKFNHRSLHPATLPWQALRIAVNHEYDEIKAGLIGAVNTLSPGGRLAVISFHSGEDRIVKNFFRDLTKSCICPPEIPTCVCQVKPMLKILNHKVITASPAEVKKNPPAHSARLRIAQKLIN